MSAPAAVAERSMPPVDWLSTTALGCVIVGGILIATYAPRRAPLAVPTVLTVLAYALMAVALVLLSRIPDFAWSTFLRLFRWSLLAYVVTSGMIEFAFVHDHTRGVTLAEVTLMLVIFAVSVPTTIAFTSARYADA